ncbi:MAG: hypothetical protein K2X38_20685 [Gemmataceae bacterium]|nr:hypothetical protein [Gemmataceae bacterium]
MRNRFFPLFLLAAGVLTFSQAAAQNHKHWCEPGYKIVECTEYKEVIRDVCKVVSDVKKVSKWVYSCKDDPFCIHTSGKSGLPCGCGKDGCPGCKGPYDRIQLVKKEIVTEIPITKCIVEKVVEVTPVKTCKKIRCTDPCPPNAVVLFDGDHPNASKK